MINLFRFFNVSLLVLTLCVNGYAQATFKGHVISEEGNPVIGATVEVLALKRGAITDVEGRFSIDNINLQAFTVSIKHIEYKDLKDTVQFDQLRKTMRFVLEPDTKFLNQVEVRGAKENENSDKVSTTEIDKETILSIPTAFGDISKVLVTLPGVSSVNELSSSFSVRGGNFDENSIYINDIPVYRPFLISAGRQEGLSVINADLVSNILFSAGGWESKYGDKLSSVLNIKYRKPSRLEGRITAGLLNSSLYLGTSNRNENLSLVLGARRKSSTYLLNTLETDGEYLPRFFDVQSLLTARFGKNKKPRTSLQWFNSYARNRYEVIPVSRTTDFGGIGSVQRLFIAFQGQENLDYDTYQTGLSFDYDFTRKFTSKLILSGVRTQEVERVNLEGAYELCDIDSDPNSSSFEKCITNRGAGTFFNSARNRLNATIITAEIRNELKINDKNLLSFGFGLNYQDLDDRLKEFEFIDSADFVNISDVRSNQINLKAINSHAYIQNRTYFKDSLQYVTLGIRANYRDINGQLLLGPRAQYSFKSHKEASTKYKLAVGLYHQPPFYRELRNRDGDVNESIAAQSALHVIAGVENIFISWGRPFKMTSEFYYKNLSNLNPYDLENVRIRYFGNNQARGYATGFDFRINGEFIKGAQSWFSLGWLRTEEDIAEDSRGLIRRPSDQRLNMGVFFQDHLKNNPTVRVNINLLYTSNLPFGPPRNDERRNTFSGDNYVRTDLGFSKIITLSDHTSQLDIESISLGLDILNLFATQNSISYTWVRDVQNVERPVPNSLSARFLNAKVSITF